MRFLLLAFSLVLISCGQSTSSKKIGVDLPQAQENPTNPNSPGNTQNPTPEYMTNVTEVDLLDVAMDVPIEIIDNRIIFKETIADSANGIRSSCAVGVTTGDAYSFILNGASLIIQTTSGQKISFNRVSGGEETIVGSWSSKSYEGPQLVMRRMTFVSQDRLVMRTHCES